MTKLSQIETYLHLIYVTNYNKITLPYILYNSEIKYHGEALNV